MEASVSATVSASRAEVWAVLADFGAVSSWAHGVDHSTMLTSSEPGDGAVRRVQVGRNALRESVVRWVPGELLSYDVQGLPKVVRHASNTWSLADEGSGTRITLTSAVTVPRPPGVGRLVLKKMLQADAGLLSGLTERVSR